MPQTANLMWYLGASSVCCGKTASSMTGPPAPSRANAFCENPPIIAMDPMRLACFRKSRRPAALLFINPPEFRELSILTRETRRNRLRSMESFCRVRSSGSAQFLVDANLLSIKYLCQGNIAPPTVPRERMQFGATSHVTMAAALTDRGSDNKRRDL